MMIEFTVVMLVMAAIVLGVVSLRRIAVEVPNEDRQYMDPPPRFYRLAGPLVRAVAHYCEWALPEATATRIRAALRRAGQDYTLTPVQFFAGKLTAAVLFAGAFVWVAKTMNFQGGITFIGAAICVFVGFYLPEKWLADMTRVRNLKLLKRLPFFLDIVTMAVESGMNLSSALQKSVEKMPPGPLLVEINRLLREVRAGKARADALRDMAARLDFGAMNSLVSALVQGELMGSSLGPILRAQAEQRRTERFQRAEKLALEAPVKMLFPLIFFIFPCTFLVIAFPIVTQLMNSGL